MTNDDALRANHDLWEAWTRINAASDFYDVPSFRSGERPIRLTDEECADIGPVGGRTLLHLQCHFGLDTLSWARLGAVVTGVDFSETAIATARELAAELGIPATFLVSNLYDLPNVFDRQFDIVYTSRGVLGWLPDIKGWARVVARYVKAGGTFYVSEIHPVAQAFENDGVTPGELRLAYPYWSHAEPLTFEVKGSYGDRDAPTDGLVEHGWDHSLGEIVTALIDAGLRIELLREHDFVEWPVDFLVRSEDGRYRLPPGTTGELPLSFSLRATKPLPDDEGAATEPARRDLGPDVEAALRDLELALARRDEAAIPGGYDAVLHEAFVEIGASGRRWTRVETLAALRAPGNPRATVDIEGLAVAAVGPGIVLVTFDAVEGGDGPGARRTRRSSTWVRDGDHWRLRFHQGTPA